MNPRKFFEDLARKKIHEASRQLGITDGILIYKPNPQFGDLVWDLQKLKIDIPTEVIEKLSDDDLKFYKTGKFINIRFNERKYGRAVLDYINKGEFRQTEVGQKILIEHTSANPTGPLHIGRARNSIIGDTLARIYKRLGNDVSVEYYMNDIGTQVEALLLGIEMFNDITYTEAYRKVYENLEQYKAKIEEYMRRAETGDYEFLKHSRTVLEPLLKDVLKDLEILDIHFDKFIWESEFILNGDVKKILEELEPYMKDENGAKYIEYNNDKIYLKRSNGTSLYFTRDIAYHKYKSLNFKISIDVLGEDHKLHFQNLEYVLHLLGIENIKAVFYSYVITKAGKMSTRRGNVVYLRDLIDEMLELSKKEIETRHPELDEAEKEDLSRRIAISAVRYNIIKYSPEKPITFSWEEALNFEGDSAPFILYSFARSNSILNKVEGAIAEGDNNFIDREMELIRKLGEYLDVLEESANSNKPNKLAKYCYELASQFNQFYRDCPVLRDDLNRDRRVQIVKAFNSVLRDALETLGLQITEKL